MCIYKSVPMDIRQAYSLELALRVKLSSPVSVVADSERAMFAVQAFDLLSPELACAIDLEYKILCEDKEIEDERHLLPDCSEAGEHFYPVTKCLCGRSVCFNCVKEFAFRKDDGTVYLYSCPSCGRNIEVEL